MTVIVKSAFAVESSPYLSVTASNCSPCLCLLAVTLGCGLRAQRTLKPHRQVPAHKYTQLSAMFHDFSINPMYK